LEKWAAKNSGILAEYQVQALGQAKVESPHPGVLLARILAWWEPSRALAVSTSGRPLTPTPMWALPPTERTNQGNCQGRTPFPGFPERAGAIPTACL